MTSVDIEIKLQKAEEHDMTSVDIEIRLQKAEEKLQKLHITLDKYPVKIKKLQDKMDSTDDESEKRWIASDISWAEQSMRAKEREIEEQEKIIENWRAKLEKARGEESMQSSYPDIFYDFRNSLVERWDDFDKIRRNRLREVRNELSYKEFFQKYTYADYELAHMSDADIHKANEKSADALLLNLWRRVKDVVGTPTDFSSLRLEDANEFEGVCLNGIVKGTDGTAEVESILAGGYNIQKLHVRTLVKKYKASAKQ